MRYSKQRKTETRALIVAAATDQLRCGGIYSLSISKIMRKLGLTNGGFYAHFKSRDALVLEALEAAMTKTADHWRCKNNSSSVDDQLAKLVTSYLHRKFDGLQKGCVVASCGAEIGRSSKKTKQQFEIKLNDILNGLTFYLSDHDSAEARQKAIVAFATMVGARILAGAVEHQDQAQEIVDFSATHILNNLGNRRAQITLKLPD